MTKKIQTLILLQTIALSIAIFFLLPTDDDWGYLCSPHINGMSLTSLLPNGTFWRPFDAIIGFVLTKIPTAYPYLNHSLILIGYIGSSLLLWNILRELKIREDVRIISTSIFLVSPAVLGTILGIDSINQDYSVFFGLLSIYFYLRFPKNYSWLIFALCATWAKENGIVYFILSPIISFTFNNDKKGNSKNLIIGVLGACLYFIARLSLQTSSVSIEEDSPYSFTISKKIVDLFSFVVGTTSVVDYISLIHKPSRNIIVVLITFLISLSFLYKLFWNKAIFKRKYLLLILCIAIAAAPHLATHFGPMHAYSTLPFFCVLIGSFLNDQQSDQLQNRFFKVTYIMFILTAICVDWHHWYCTYSSSKVGPQMAAKVIEKTQGNPQNILCITIMDDYPRFSSFCVPPRDVFREGYAVRRQTKYEWPKKIRSLQVASLKQASKVVRVAQQSGDYDYIWITFKDQVKVIKNRK